MFEDYAIDGEDLDWTKVTDPRERKRLQNIINGRKYRERRLAGDVDSNGAPSPRPDTPSQEGGGPFGQMNMGGTAVGGFR